MPEMAPVLTEVYHNIDDVMHFLNRNNLLDIDIYL